MSIKSYENAVKSESAAKKYVSKYLRKNGHAFCPFCRSREFWKTGDGRRRCKRCKKVYHDLTRRWWNKVKLPLDDWLRVVYQFHLRFVVVPAKKPPRFPKVNGGVERKKDASA